jgi:hypothetical protein
MKKSEDAISALVKMDKFKFHVKNWKPHILAICPIPHKHD